MNRPIEKVVRQIYWKNFTMTFLKARILAAILFKQTSVKKYFSARKIIMIYFRFGCCSFMGETCPGKIWTCTRQLIHDIVDNPFFEWTILLLIFASSLSLCFEDINLQDNEELMFILKIVNLVFAVLFFIEMLLKWVAFGLWRYFTNAWTCLDFVIVCVS
jgi:hypothetical protein